MVTGWEGKDNGVMRSRVISLGRLNVRLGLSDSVAAAQGDGILLEPYASRTF